MSAGEVSQYWTDQALQFMRQHPGQWLRLLVWKTYLTLHGLELVDSEGIEVYARHSLVLRSLLWLNFGVLVPLATVGVWASRDQWRRVAVLLASVAVLIVSVALFFVFARYRYPLVPFLVLFSGAALSQLGPMAQDWKAGRFLTQWSLGLLIALLLVIPLNWPMPEYRDDCIAYANYGRELLDEGNYPMAEKSLRMAISLGPNAPGPAYNLARVYDLQGQSQAARKQYQSVLAIDPNHGMSLWMLGRLAIADQNLSEADQLLARASQLLPDNAHVRSDLGQNRLNLKDLPGAIEQFRLALRIDPTLVSAANNLTWLLATAPVGKLRNGQEALHWAKQLEKIEDPNLLDTAAAAYAQCGMFDEAIGLVQRAQQLAQSAGNAALAAELSSRTDQYAARQAWPIDE
jgi:tetratricopeptide (TPR) repeat protein